MSLTTEPGHLYLSLRYLLAISGSSSPTGGRWCRSRRKSASAVWRSKTSVVIEPVWPTNRRRSCRGGHVPEMNHVAAAGRGQQCRGRRSKAPALRRAAPADRPRACPRRHPAAARCAAGRPRPELSVGRIGQGANPPRRDLHVGHLSAAVGVPNADHAGAAGRGHPRAVGREGDGADVAARRGQFAEQAVPDRRRRPTPCRRSPPPPASARRGCRPSV